MISSSSNINCHPKSVWKNLDRNHEKTKKTKHDPSWEENQRLQQIMNEQKLKNSELMEDIQRNINNLSDEMILLEKNIKRAESNLNGPVMSLVSVMHSILSIFRDTFFTNFPTSKPLKNLRFEKRHPYVIVIDTNRE